MKLKVGALQVTYRYTKNLYVWSTEEFLSYERILKINQYGMGNFLKQRKKIELRLEIMNMI